MAECTTREMLGRIEERQEAHGKQLDRVETKVDQAWKWANDHRTGVKIILWLGATAIAVFAAMKGLSR